MKLGELCEVVNTAMLVEYRDESDEYHSFWVHGISFQQKIHRCKEFARWDVSAIEPNFEYPDRINIEIVKPEEEE